MDSNALTSHITYIPVCIAQADLVVQNIGQSHNVSELELALGH